MFISKDDSLHWYYDGEHLQIQPWGPDAFRVRSTVLHTMPQHQWALSEPVGAPKVQINFPPEQPTLEPPGISLHGSHKTTATHPLRTDILRLGLPLMVN